MADGECITNQDDILTEAHTFYQSLYNNTFTNSKDDFNKYISNSNILKLENSESIYFEGDIHMYTIKNMKNIKSPGSDGFPADFFKNYFG